jgi:hypothetical protein
MYMWPVSVPAANRPEEEENDKAWSRWFLTWACAAAVALSPPTAWDERERLYVSSFSVSQHRTKGSSMEAVHKTPFQAMQESLLEAPPLIETLARDKAVSEPSGNTPMCAINKDFVITTSRLGSNGSEEEEEELDNGDAYSKISTGEWRFERTSKLRPESSPNETTPASVAKKKEKGDWPKGGTDAINCVCCWAVKIVTGGAEEAREDLDPFVEVDEEEEVLAPPPGIKLPG